MATPIDVVVFKFREWNDFELIQMVKMETRHPLEGSFGSEFLVICNHRRVMAA